MPRAEPLACGRAGFLCSSAVPAQPVAGSNSFAHDRSERVADGACLRDINGGYGQRVGTDVRRLQRRQGRAGVLLRAQMPHFLVHMNPRPTNRRRAG